MTRNNALSIKGWLKRMGFKLTKSHSLQHHTRKINYYTLGNFGIYEETELKNKAQSAPDKKRKFISWTPWGDNFEVQSLKDLRDAYEEFMKYNPEVVLN